MISRDVPLYFRKDVPYASCLQRIPFHTTHPKVRTGLTTQVEIQCTILLSTPAPIHGILAHALTSLLILSLISYHSTMTRNSYNAYRSIPGVMVNSLFTLKDGFCCCISSPCMLSSERGPLSWKFIHIYIYIYI